MFFPAIWSVWLAACVYGHQTPLVLPRKRVLVIGAGASGSSLVYSLRSNPKVEITVFERSALIGGRARVTEFENLTIELGASIFSVNNFLMHNASKEFDLEHSSPELTGKYEFGVWNGQDWHWKHDGSWLGNIKFLLKYGIRNGPLQVKKYVSQLATIFFKIYEQLSTGPAFDNLGDEIFDLGLGAAAHMNCKDYYLSLGISELYIDQIMGAVLRNIYLSNVDHVHAMGCSIAMYAASIETFSIKGGNYQLFEHMLKGQTVKLETVVTRVANLGNSIAVDSIKDGFESTDEFDHVVLATPIQGSGIDFVGFDTSRWVNDIKYIELHVTLVFGRLNHGYFKSESESDIPIDIFTSAEADAPFHCLSIHKQVNSTHSISKLFSDHMLTDDELSMFYIETVNVIRHSWDHPGSYPDLMPRNNWNYTVNDGNFWYLNGFEAFISTMETSGLAAVNVARHLANI